MSIVTKYDKVKYNVIVIFVYNILLRVQFHTLSNTGMAKQTPCTSRQTR